MKIEGIIPNDFKLYYKDNQNSMGLTLKSQARTIA
jgi:hypothetical protein